METLIRTILTALAGGLTVLLMAFDSGQFAIFPANAQETTQAPLEEETSEDNVTTVEVVEVVEQEEVVEAAPVYAITMFSPSWFKCGPCEEAKEHRIDWLKQYYDNVDVCLVDETDNVDSFPTWVMTRDGVEVHRWSGHAWSPAGTAEMNRNIGIGLGITPPPPPPPPPPASSPEVTGGPRMYVHYETVYRRSNGRRMR